MYKIKAIFLLCLAANVLKAQHLNEETSMHYYWRNLLPSSRLYTEAGLSKQLWMANLPADWTAAYAYEHYSLQADGLFGNMLLANDYIPKFGFQSKMSQWGEKDLSLHTQINSKKIKTNFRVNGFHFDRPMDKNQDGFTDLNNKQRLFISNTWEAHVPNYTSSNRIQFMGLREQGGSMNAFVDSMVNAYSTQLDMRHLSMQSQHLIATRKKDLFLLDFQFKDHLQNRLWGSRDYMGREWMVDAQGRYEYHLDNEFDIFRIGLQYRMQRVEESIDSLNRLREEKTGGLSIGYDTYWGKNIQLITNINILYHNLAGLQISPTLKVNYSPFKNLAVNAFAGHGWRYANPLTEYSHYLYSNRSLQLPTGNFLPEEAWYYGAGISANQWVNLGYAPFASFFIAANSHFVHRIYQQQVIADLDANAYELRFYNLQEGEKAFKLSWEMDAQISWTKPALTLNIDYRLDLAKANIDGVFRELPFYSRHNWLFNLQHVARYRIARKDVYFFNLNSDCYLQSAQRIPDLSSKGNGQDMGLISQQNIRWDLRFDFPIYDWIPGRSKWKNFLLQLGFDNLTNNIQRQVFIAANDPYSPEFDGGMRWNTMVHRRFYVGAKYIFN